MKKKIAIIGAGFSGLSAAAYAARAGMEVHVFEKHGQPGGRARQYATAEGFRFDMGPSWYWMPDVIEQFFQDFGCQTADFFDLVSLDPQFEIVFRKQTMRVPRCLNELRALFEQTEPGAGRQLDRFLQAAQFKYEVGMRQFVHQPCHSISEFLSPALARHAIHLDLFRNFRSYVCKYFKSETLRTLMEFPVIFLGASPQKIPALYSLMNYGGYALGTHYPMGGFYQLVKAMHKVGLRQGVHFHFNANVERIDASNGKVNALCINGETIAFDSVIASSDYHHTESLLRPKLRNYKEAYWAKSTFAPSCLIYYLGINRKIPNLKHHTLFFENDLDQHITSIYDTKTWPKKPLFYACCPSKTDPSVAPEGKENLFLLMPLAMGIADEDATREHYLAEMITRLETHTGMVNLRAELVYKRSYCVSDFRADYNAYGGNAYGLANTLGQTAVLKPKLRNKKLKNLFYAGQLTVPGPGVPPSIISGKIAATELIKLNPLS